MSTPTSGDLLLVNRGGVNYQIDFDDMSTLQDTDLLLVNRGGTNYQIEAQYINTGGNGVIVPEVEVLTPLDRAGDPELTYLKTDRIVAIEDGGTATYETDTIQSVDILEADYKPARTETTVNSVDWSSITETQRLDASQKPSLGGNAYFSVYKFDSPQRFSWGTDVGGGAFNVSYFYSSTGAANSWVFDSNATGVNPNGEVVYSTNTAEYWVAVYAGTASPITSPDATHTLEHGVNSWSITSAGTPQILTFPTSNNFDKFAVNDQTQVFGVAYETTVPENTWQISTDPFLDGGSFLAYTPGETSSITFTYPEPVDFSSINNFRGGSYSVGVAYTMTFTDSVGNVTSGSSTTNSGYGTTALPLTPPSLVKSFTIQGSDGFGFLGFYNGGSFVPTGQLGVTQTITAIDSNANTITVDGGEWDSSPSQYDKSYVWATTANDSGLSSNSSWTHVFDNPNDPALSATVADASYVAAVDKYQQATLNLPVEISGTVDIFASKYTTSTGQTQSFVDFMYNGTIVQRYDVSSVRSYEAGWQGEVTLSGPVNQIRLYDGNTTQFAGVALQAVKNNGKILVNSGIDTGDDKIIKTITYDTKLTLEGSTDLAQMALGPAVMTDGVLGGSGYSQTPYTLTTTDITSVSGTAPAITLAFPGDVSTNPDLRYFQVNDVLKGLEQQDWAATGTSSNWAPSAPIAYAFDGDESLAAYPNPETTGSYTFATPLSYSSQVEILCMASVQQDPEFKVNGQLVSLVPSDGKIWRDVTSILDATGGTFQSFTTSYSSNNWLTYIWAIRVDGIVLQNGGTSTAVKVVSTDLAANTMTVDGGEWSVDINNSQVWTSNLSVATGIFDMYAGQAFNNDPTNYARSTDDSVVMTLDINPPLNVSSSIEVKPGVGTSFEFVATVNGYDVTTTGALGTFSNTGSLSKVTIKNLDPGRTSLEYIKVDGKTLVDTGVGGDPRVEFQSPGGTGDIVEINTSDNTMLLSNSNNRWISNNKADTAFSVAAGSLANPPAPNYLDITFTSMNAGTTPFTGVDATLSSRTWTLETAPDKAGPWTLVDTYEEFDMTASQDGATEWTTGKPVLLQSTWYRVKVTYNSTAAESVESVYHTFKTAV